MAVAGGVLIFPIAFWIFDSKTSKSVVRDWLQIPVIGVRVAVSGNVRPSNYAVVYDGFPVLQRDRAIARW